MHRVAVIVLSMCLLHRVTLAEEAWVLEPRELPLPAAASEPLRRSIASGGKPLLGEFPSTLDGWRTFATNADNARAAL